MVINEQNVSGFNQSRTVPADMLLTPSLTPSTWKFSFHTNFEKKKKKK